MMYLQSQSQSRSRSPLESGSGSSSGPPAFPFLGSAIATLGGGPFLATEAVAVGTLGQTRVQRLIRMHGLGPAMRQRFKVAFLCCAEEGNGQEYWIWGPPVRAVEEWTWIFEPLIAVVPFYTGRTKLIDDQGYVLDTTTVTVEHRVERREALTLTYPLYPPDVKSLKNDCTIKAPCERLIVARHLAPLRANAQGARGGVGASASITPLKRPQARDGAASGLQSHCEGSGDPVSGVRRALAGDLT